MLKTTTWLNPLDRNTMKKFVELFDSEEFFEEEDPNYIMEEINVVYGAKFEPLDL